MTSVSKASFAIGVLLAAGCSGSTSSSTAGAAPAPSGGGAYMAMNAPITPQSPDPRVGLKAGAQDAGEAAWNVRKISHTPPPEGFAGITNSDLGFSGTNVIQGNYNGFQIWDISNPAQPRLRVGTICPASQSDVSVYKNLLFVSAEATSARLDCGKDAALGSVNKDRIRGVRIFEISDIDHPKYIANVQTCRGSHTHTVVHDPRDTANIYIYVSGTSGIRPAAELAGCNPNPLDVNTSLFNIEVIKVPLAHPEQAAIVAHPRIFSDEKTGAALGLVNTVGTHGAPPADTGAAGRGGRGGGGRGGAPGAAAMLFFTRSGICGGAGVFAQVQALSATSSRADSARFQQDRGFPACRGLC